MITLMISFTIIELILRQLGEVGVFLCLLGLNTSLEIIGGNNEDTERCGVNVTKNVLSKLSLLAN